VSVIDKPLINESVHSTPLSRLHQFVETRQCDDLSLLVADTTAVYRDQTIGREKLALMIEAARLCYPRLATQAGLKIASMAKDTAFEYADAPSAIHASMLKGIFLADAGSYPDALDAYADAFTMAQAAQDSVFEAKIWRNVSVACRYAGLFSESVECSRRAIDIASDIPEMQSDLFGYFANIATVSLATGEIDQGLEAAANACELYCHAKRTEGDVLTRVFVERTFMMLVLAKNDLDAARAHASAARDLAASAGPRAAIIATIAQGTVDVYAGLADIGLSRLHSALDEAIKADSTAAIVSAREALAHCYDKLGMQDAAYEQFVALILRQKESRTVSFLQSVEHCGNGRSDFADKTLAIERLVAASDLRDEPSGLGSHRVGWLAEKLAVAAQAPAAIAQNISRSACLRDIGKFVLADHVQNQRGTYSVAERRVMNLHAEYGGELLRRSGIPGIDLAVSIAESHHEHFDGSGYPKGLAGSNIPLESRIVAIAEAYDSITHGRRYRPAKSIDEALELIIAQAGAQFDPELVALFVPMVRSLSANNKLNDDSFDEIARRRAFSQGQTRIWAALRMSKVEYASSKARALDYQR
jgi:putative two-component system response regulator